MLTNSKSAILGIVSFCALMLGALAQPVEAAPSNWRIDPNASSIVITFDIDGKPRQGGFETFRGEARFDPAKLEDAVLRFEIDTASIDLDEPFATDFVKSIDWLFVEEHPVAIYELQRLERVDGDRFKAFGQLTMRGKTHPVTGHLTLRLDENDGAAVGEAGFNRKDFNVGVGFSTLFVEIGPQIGVSFNLKATRVE